MMVNTVGRVVVILASQDLISRQMLAEMSSQSRDVTMEIDEGVGYRQLCLNPVRTLGFRCIIFLDGNIF